jgi:uncharacterized protein involved in response to NO
MKAAPGGIPRYKSTHAPALFSEGYRPFFLGSAVWAVLSIVMWLCILAGRFDIPTGFDPISWHAHEMIYGFAVAAMAGFLLTAIPNWTGRFPLQGAPLALLFLVWCVGRIAMAASGIIGTLPAALVDMSFIAVFLCAVAREVFFGRNWRNLPALVALSLLLVGNGLMHLEAAEFFAAGKVGARLGLAVFAALITLIGGRIIPSFTRNRLIKLGATRLPAPANLLDKLALRLVPIALASWVLDVVDGFQGTLLLAAGIISAMRLARWRGLAIWRDALIFVLHLGYGWLSLGLMLLGLSQISAAIPAMAALHALGSGAVGTMTLAVMIRAVLAHTGRSQVAGKSTVILYGLLQAAALLRVATAFLPDAHTLLIGMSGAAWSVTFATFALVHGRCLIRPRIGQRRSPLA